MKYLIEHGNDEHVGWLKPLYTLLGHNANLDLTPYMGVPKNPKKGLGSVHMGIYAIIVCHFIDIIAYLWIAVNGGFDTNQLHN